MLSIDADSPPLQPCAASPFLAKRLEKSRFVWPPIIDERLRLTPAQLQLLIDCGGTLLTMVGVDERELLEYVPSHFKVIVHCRPSMSCRACETMFQPPMPELPIERGRPGPALLAHVLAAKYCDHCVSR